MLTFADSFTCDCGKTFNWKYIKLENREVFVGKLEERSNNCINFVDTNNICTVEIECPNCKKRYIITIR